MKMALPTQTELETVRAAFSEWWGAIKVVVFILSRRFQSADGLWDRLAEMQTGIVWYLLVITPDA